ncbi:hypothetical protein LMG23992_05115 [Cupriavidus laharis]|uniref:Uncharacterized protein n=1 Tax=Cupriavidus laharis TaxID=151654 RepID=A0ABM8XUA6_9BURK|nr:hypothetical protein LMG23992_05115 [Cupriavidus laharis]
MHPISMMPLPKLALYPEKSSHTSLPCQFCRNARACSPLRLGAN